MRAIKNWAIATFILCFLVIIAGAVVRTTQSGMGCPDWPRCFGKWIPPTDASQLPPDFEKYLGKQDIDHSFNVYHTWIEYFNRLLGVLLGIFAIIQLVLISRKRRFVRKPFVLSIFFLLAVILTGLFGALVVKFNLQHLSISVHLLFAIILVQIQLALIMHLNESIGDISIPRRVRLFIYMFLILLFIQSILGTLVRMHVDDVSKQLDYVQREKWLIDLPVSFLIHRSFSWIVLACSFLCLWMSRNIPLIRIAVILLTGVIILNMIAGITLSNFDMPAFAQPLHLLLASVAITQATHLILKTRNK